MNVAAALKAQVLQQLLANVVGTSFELSGHPLSATSEAALQGWPTARVTLHGARTLHLWIAIKPDLGRHIVASAVGCTPDEVSLEMIQDVAAELANMLAGQVKSTLGEACELGLPQATAPYAGPVISDTYFAALAQGVEDLYVAVA